MKTLKDLFLSELGDIYDAEQRIAKGLPKLAKAATAPGLKEAFLTHLKETEGQVTKVERVFACFDEKPKTEKCEATIGLLVEADQMAADFKGSPALDSALIAAAQKVEHYEMASYGCLHEWARVLGNAEAARLLKEILEEESSANDTLNALALAICNKQAAGKKEPASAAKAKRS